MFYVMDCVDGRVLWDPGLPGMQPHERRAHFDELGRVMAALHCVDPAAIGLADYGKPGNYIERQVARWTRQYRAAETEKIEAVERLIEWLPAHVPPGDETRIVHGDYRFDNVIFHPTEPRILAVLDWELSTLGHPLVDFAYHCMAWHMPGGEGSRGLAGPGPGGAGHSERSRVPAGLPAAHRPHRAGQPRALDLLPGVRHVPAGGHRAGHQGAGAAGQRLERAGACRPAAARARWPSRPGRWRRRSI